MNCKNEHGQSSLALGLLGWKTLEEQRAQSTARLMYKVLHNMAPTKLNEIFNMSNTVHGHNLRGSNSTFFLPRSRTEYLKKVSVLEDQEYGILCPNKLEIANPYPYLMLTSLASASLFNNNI